MKTRNRPKFEPARLLLWLPRMRLSDGSARLIGAMQAGSSVSAEALAAHDDDVVLRDGHVDLVATEKNMSPQALAAKRAAIDRGGDTATFASFVSGMVVTAALSPVAGVATTIAGVQLSKAITNRRLAALDAREREDRQAFELFAKQQGNGGLLPSRGAAVELVEPN